MKTQMKTLTHRTEQTGDVRSIPLPCCGSDIHKLLAQYIKNATMYQSDNRNPVYLVMGIPGGFHITYEKVSTLTAIGEGRLTGRVPAQFVFTLFHDTQRITDNYVGSVDKDLWLTTNLVCESLHTDEVWSMAADLEECFAEVLMSTEG